MAELSSEARGAVNHYQAAVLGVAQAMEAAQAAVQLGTTVEIERAADRITAATNRLREAKAKFREVLEHDASAAALVADPELAEILAGINRHMDT